MILINSSPKDTLRIFQPFLPIYLPLGIGYLLAVAEKEDIPIRFIDEQVEDDVLGAVDRYVKQMEKPYIFGFSALTAAMKSAVSVSGELKRRYPDSIIVFGGVHPTAMPEEVLSYKHIDVVIRGEAERVLVDFYRRVKENKDFTVLENVSYRKNGRIIHNKPGSIVDDLDSLPDFPYHLFASKRYDLGAMLSSRGCPYECIFCSNRVVTGKRYRFRAAKAIADDLEMLYKKYNKRHVNFVDDNLLVNRERIYLLMDDIKKRGLRGKMSFNFQARGDNVDPALLRDLYDSGFRSIFFGMETSSEKIMKNIKKNETVAQCTEAVRMAKKIGFHVSATFIYGLPGETNMDRLECLNLSRDLQLDRVRYNNATPYPGTELYEIAKRENSLHVQGLYENFASVATFIENPFKRIPFSYVPKGNTEAEIRRDILFSFFSFYFDITRLKKALKRPYEGRGWFNIGESVSEILKRTSALLLLGLFLPVKFAQLFYYCVIKKETSISPKYFMKVFEGLKKREMPKDCKGKHNVRVN
jgi:anaerobic magnesium-protoporphyrin IX monomethyl ester cyclase